MGFTPKFRQTLRKNERINYVIPRNNGKVWEMAATSLHDDVFLDSEECHEREAHCLRCQP